MGILGNMRSLTQGIDLQRLTNIQSSIVNPVSDKINIPKQCRSCGASKSKDYKCIYCGNDLV